MSNKLNVNPVNDDLSIEDLEAVDLTTFNDLPEFRTFPDCLVNVSPEVKVKSINDQPTVIISFTNIGVIEYVNENIMENDKLKEGDVTSIMFGLGGEIGQGSIKKFVMDFLYKHTNSTDLGANMKFINNLNSIKILFKETKPNKEGKTYNRIVSLDID